MQKQKMHLDFLKNRKKRENFEKKGNLFWVFLKITKLVPETKSQNSEDHEFRNHKMRGSPSPYLIIQGSSNHSKDLSSGRVAGCSYFKD